MTRQTIIEYLRQFTDKSVQLKKFGEGYLFWVNGEWYMHQCDETGKVAEKVKADGKYDISFPSIGARYYIREKEQGER